MVVKAVSGMAVGALCADGLLDKIEERFEASRTTVMMLFRWEQL
jgi:hypothetical protein